MKERKLELTIAYTAVVGKIVKSRIKWAGHVVRMKEERLQKIVDTKKQGCRN